MSKQAHEVCIEMGIDRDRLQRAFDNEPNWGKLVNAFEVVTAVSAVLGSWPDD